MRDKEEKKEAEEMEWIQEFKREILAIGAHKKMEDCPDWEEKWRDQAIADQEKVWEKISRKIRE